MLPIRTFAEPTEPVILNLENGNIDLTPTGYSQGGPEVPYTGSYIITGSRTDGTPLEFINNSGQPYTFNLTFDNVQIISKKWASAISFSGNSPIILNLTNVGSSFINSSNHPAFQSGNGIEFTVNIINVGDGSFRTKKD